MLNQNNIPFDVETLFGGMHIVYVTNETFSEFTKYHFGKVMPNNREVKKDTLFAEIQTEVMVGKTFEDILEKYTLLKLIKRR